MINIPMNEFRLIPFGISFPTVEFGSRVTFVFNSIVYCCRQTSCIYSPTHAGLARNYDGGQRGNQIRNQVSPFRRFCWSSPWQRKPFKCYLKFRLSQIFCLNIKRTNDKQMSLLFPKWQLPVSIHVKDVTNNIGIQISKSF